MDKATQAIHKDLCMMRDRIRGLSIKEIASVWGCTVRTASRHVNAVASDCMRRAMLETQGDPDHPATMRFTVEEFTRDPREAMVAIMEEELSKIELLYPEINERD